MASSFPAGTQLLCYATLTKERLDRVPATCLEDGIARTAEWLHEHMDRDEVKQYLV